jgi:hypothetical protein
MRDELYDPFVWPLVIGLACLFGGWLYYAHRKLWSEKPMPRGRIYRCAGCGHVYVETRDVPMSMCSQCGRFNEAVKR